MENMRAAPSYGLMTQSVCALSFHVLIRLIVHTLIYVNCVLNRTTTTFFYSFLLTIILQTWETKVSLLLDSASSPLASSSWSHLRSTTRPLFWSAESPESKDHLNLISCSSLTIRLFWAYFTEIGFKFLYIIIILCCQAVFTSLFSPQWCDCRCEASINSR